MSANFNSAYDLCISIYYAASMAVFANLYIYILYTTCTERLSKSVKLHGRGRHCLKNTHLLFSSSSTCPIGHSHPGAIIGWQAGKGILHVAGWPGQLTPCGLNTWPGIGQAAWLKIKHAYMLHLVKRVSTLQSTDMVASGVDKGGGGG